MQNTYAALDVKEQKGISACGNFQLAIQQDNDPHAQNQRPTAAIYCNLLHCLAVFSCSSMIKNVNVTIMLMPFWAQLLRITCMTSGNLQAEKTIVVQTINYQKINKQPLLYKSQNAPDAPPCWARVPVSASTGLGSGAYTKTKSRAADSTPFCQLSTLLAVWGLCKLCRSLNSFLNFNCGLSGDMH